jgi:hypothetical protein
MTALATKTRAPNPHQDFWGPFPFDVPQESSTATIKIHGVKGRTVRLDRVWYNNPTGFAQDPSAYWTIAIKNGSTVLASWSTQTGAQGTLTGDTPVELVKGTNLDVTDSDVLTCVLTKTGAPAALPAGRVVLEGHVL